MTRKIWKSGRMTRMRRERRGEAKENNSRIAMSPVNFFQSVK
jgi:hypothetical protein